MGMTRELKGCLNPDACVAARECTAPADCVAGARDELQKMQARYEKLKEGHDRALEMLGAQMFDSAKADKKRGPAERSTAELDDLLAVLRKHGVEDFKQDEFGLHIKLTHRRALVELEDMLGAQRKEWAQQDAALAEPEEEPVRREPGPPDNVINPQRYSKSDLLPGAE